MKTALDGIAFPAQPGVEQNKRPAKYHIDHQNVQHEGQQFQAAKHPCLRRDSLR
ncbi:MAG: hypothetical protein GF313_06465 [Caldithrix sp.]|nr:hypothetical protein [Caldithrix sp.]